jgi:hypothetical protein
MEADDEDEQFNYTTVCDAWRWLSLPHARAPLAAWSSQAAPTNVATLPDKVTSTNMASNVEQSIFFQQRRAKDELIVRGQYTATAAGAPLTHIDPPKFDLESYIANYAGTSASLPISPHCHQALTQTQAVRESTASITSARTRRTSPSMHTAWPLPRQRRARMSTSTCNWRRS